MQTTHPKFIISEHVARGKDPNNHYVFMYNYITENYSNVHILGQYHGKYFEIENNVDNFQIDFWGIKHAGRKLDSVGGVITGPWLLLSPNHGWSLINKGNAVYSNEEWESVVLWSISGDKESRNLALSMLKNADYTDTRLVSMCLSLLHRADSGVVDDQLFKVICGIHNEKNYKNRDNNLDMMMCYVSSVPVNRRAIFNNNNVTDIFTRKYKGYLSIGEIKVK